MRWPEGPLHLTTNPHLFVFFLLSGLPTPPPPPKTKKHKDKTFCPQIVIFLFNSVSPSLCFYLHVLCFSLSVYLFLFFALAFFSFVLLFFLLFFCFFPFFLDLLLQNGNRRRKSKRFVSTSVSCFFPLTCPKKTTNNTINLFKMGLQNNDIFVDNLCFKIRVALCFLGNPFWGWLCSSSKTR